MTGKTRAKTPEPLRKRAGQAWSLRSHLRGFPPRQVSAPGRAHGLLEWVGTTRSLDPEGLLSLLTRGFARFGAAAVAGQCFYMKLAMSMSCIEIFVIYNYQNIHVDVFGLSGHTRCWVSAGCPHYLRLPVPKPRPDSQAMRCGGDMNRRSSLGLAMLLLVCGGAFSGCDAGDVLVIRQAGKSEHMPVASSSFNVSSSPSPTPANTPSPTASPSSSPLPSLSPTPASTSSPSPSPTPAPTSSPSSTPVPTQTPTPSPAAPSSFILLIRFDQ